MSYITKQSTATEKDTPYSVALESYFDALEQIDKLKRIRSARIDYIKLNRLQRQLAEAALECRTLDEKRIETVKTK